MRALVRRMVCFLLAAVLWAGIITGGAAEEDGIHVVILGTSDMHGNIWGYSYEDDAEMDNNGMARLYTYIPKVREENPIVFLVDGGMRSRAPS